ncbi:AAA family ATPase [Longispora sp. NPDC051575]|uniref:helix-turn-helix transcriptional regulator n=1 Tax=Longispora sp. NPDC051575 TaxID=3154943 RepID=UPI0034422F05
MEDAPELLGRRAALARCEAGLAETGGVLVTGPAGIGKSALLAAVARAAADSGALVLRSGSSPTEAALPYLAVFDLFSALADEETGLLTPRLRAALDGAMLRTVPADGAPPERLAVRVAVLHLLRGAARRGPVLVVVDDAQWLDAESTEALAFAARRLADAPVRFLVAERVEEDAEPRCQGLVPAPGREVALDRLPDAVLAELLSRQFDLGPTSRMSARIRSVSAGNPLFALELGRALRRGQPVGDAGPLRVPERLRRLLADRIGALPDLARASLLVLAAAARPTRALLPPDDAGLAACVDAGVVVGGPDLRLSHPLIGEIVYADASTSQRLSCHAHLAAVLPDPVERAGHLALATPGADAAVADELAATARVALLRGAPGTAADLYRLAAARTPEDPHREAERRLAGAWHAFEAGRPDLARDCCAHVLRGPNAAARVEARLLLIELGGRDHAGSDALLDEAETDAGDDQHLLARVALYRADLAFQHGHLAESLAALDLAEELTTATGDVDLRIEILALRAPVTMQYAPRDADALLARGAALAAGRPLTESSVLLRRVSVAALLRSGEIDAAVDEVSRLRLDVERAGRINDLAEVMRLSTAVYERAGRCTEAYESGRHAGRLRTEIEATPGPGLVLCGMAELNGGTAEEAARFADEAVAACERPQDTEWLAYAHGLRGRAAVLLGRTTDAVRALSRAHGLLLGLGFVDPALFLIHADLAEAHARNGDVDSARAVLAEATRQVEYLDRRVVGLGLVRAARLADAVVGDAHLAADRLRAALPAAHPYPLEIARAYLTLADIERRARRRAASRTALREAADRFAEAGCVPWRVYAEDQLRRLDGPAPTLTALQRGIVTMVCYGATNREIAATMHLSVKTVEGNLTQIYRRLDVRNRAELALWMPGRVTGPSSPGA